MEAYLIYIGKSALAAGAFYLVYLLLFQNHKEFVFNRIYLPVSLALSFIIPLITFTKTHFIEAVTTSSLDNSTLLTYLPETTQEIQFTLQWVQYLIGIYLLGIAIFLFHLLTGHLKAIAIVRFSRIKKLFKTEVNITSKDVHPFSFFNKIVLSEKTLKNPTLEIIVSHENIHVKEKHTLDILFAEILFLLQWFNPFAWLIKDAIKNNLEYKTDHQIAKSYNQQDYQLAMVSLADKQGVAPFLTALNGSQLKNRIIMMKKKTENKYAFLKQLVVLPLLAILIMGLANRNIKKEIAQPEEKSGIEITGKVSNEAVEAIPGVSVFVKDKKVGTITDLDGNYKLQLEEDGLLVFVIEDYERQEIRFDENSSVVNVLLKMNDLEKLKQAEKKPLIIIDGETFVGEMSEINNENIESVDVLKDASATTIYGSKGKNGVILITTKAAATAKAIEKAQLIVDGREYKGDINDIPPSDILSMEIKKNQADDNFYDSIGAPKDEIIIQTKTKYNSEDITTPFELRKFIAKRIKYPKEAQENNLNGNVSFLFKVDKKGNIYDLMEKGGKDFIKMEEVVVVAYKSDIPGRNIKEVEWKVLNDEVVRVMNIVPSIQIPEYFGKTIQVSVAFTQEYK